MFGLEYRALGAVSLSGSPWVIVGVTFIVNQALLIGMIDEDFQRVISQCKYAATMMNIQRSDKEKREKVW